MEWGRNLFNSTTWIDVGSEANRIEHLPKAAAEAAVAQIQYREVGYSSVPTNVDGVELTLKIQSGEAVDRFAMIGLSSCYAPRVRDGQPSVQCRMLGGEIVILSGDETEREQLLRVDAPNYGLVVVKAVGMYTDETPMLYVQ
jgi:hypothetical protein